MTEPAPVPDPDSATAATPAPAALDRNHGPAWAGMRKALRACCED